MKIALRISIAFNLFLVAFFLLKRWNFQYEIAHPAKLQNYAANPEYKEQYNIQEAYSRKPTIVMLGNSHMYKVHWDELLNRGDVANRGIGSDITAGYLHRLGAILQVHPRICFIEGGSNDIYYHYSNDSIIHNLSIIVDALRNEGIIPVLHLLPPYAATEPTHVQMNISIILLNKIISAMAKIKKVDCIDLYAPLTWNGVLKPVYSQADGVHLTGAAYLIWGKAIQAVLSSHGL